MKLKDFVVKHKKSLLRLLRILIVAYFLINLIILIQPAIKYGLFARYELVEPIPHPSTYFFTGIVYYLCGAILAAFMHRPYRAFFVLIFGAFFQEYTWNFTYLVLFPNSAFLPLHPLSLLWVAYIVGVGAMGSIVMYAERKNMKFSYFLIPYFLYFVFYAMIGMPITPHGVGFSTESIYESVPIVLSLLVAATSFRWRARYELDW